MSKKSLAIILSSLLALPLALADLGTKFKNVWDKIIYLFGFGFLNLGADTALIAFLRLLMIVLLFSIFFSTITGLKSASIKPFDFFTRGQAGIVAAIISIIATIFMPAEVLAATGAGWAVLISLVLIGGPVVGLVMLMYKYPGPGKDTKGIVLLKIFLCLILAWILTAVKYHVGRLGF